MFLSLFIIALGEETKADWDVLGYGYLRWRTQILGIGFSDVELYAITSNSYLCMGAKLLLALRKVLAQVLLKSS